MSKNTNEIIEKSLSTKFYREVLLFILCEGKEK